MENNVTRVVRMALENMYMFGGMPRPDPKYDEYIEKMEKMIHDAVVAEMHDLAPLLDEDGNPEE